MKLTNQEINIINYIGNKSEVSWQELAQFAKDPQNVKMKTLQKAVSDIKKKYRDKNLFAPFNCKFINLSAKEVFEEIKLPTFVKLRITAGANRVPDTNKDLDAHIDFQLDRNYRRVKTRSNTVNLSDNEWELFTHLHQNAEKMISIDDMKDVVYKGFGSKTPHNWCDSIKRTLGKLRTNIRELKTEGRLVTIMGTNKTPTSYMLK